MPVVTGIGETVILGRTQVGHRNDSGYAFDYAKWRARPAGIHEVDGYRTRFRCDDHEVSRVFDVPAGAADAFQEWALGYAFSSLDFVLGRDVRGAITVEDGRNFYGTMPPPAGTTPPADVSWSLRRVIPAQDPVRPWLFASSVEMMQGMACVIDDPANLLLGRDGEPLLVNALNENPVEPGEPGLPFRVPALTYASIDQALPGETPGGIVDGIGLAGTLTKYFREGFIRYRVTFTPRPYAVRNDADSEALGLGEVGRYVSVQTKHNLEAITLNRLAQSDTRNLLMFAEGPYGPPPAGTGPVQVPEAGVLQMATGMLTLTWHDVPDVPDAAYSLCVGQINADPLILPQGHPTYDRETLLMLPWVKEQRTGPTGRVMWKVALNFAYRASRWNRFPHAQSARTGLSLATFGGRPDGATVYPRAAQMNRLLWTVPPPVRYI